MQGCNYNKDTRDSRIWRTTAYITIEKQVDRIKYGACNSKTKVTRIVD